MEDDGDTKCTGNEKQDIDVVVLQGCGNPRPRNVAIVLRTNFDWDILCRPFMP